MARIFVSAGHSSSDPGAVYHGTTEYNELVRILPEAIRLARPHLKKGDSLVEIPAVYGYVEAVQYFLKNANRSTDLFTEVHLNANVGAPGTGTETWYGGLKVFADNLNSSFVRGMRRKYANWVNRGTKFSTFYYITRVLSSDGNIMELGFLNNKTDLNRLREQGARGLAEAFLSVSHEKLFAIPEPPKPAPKPTPIPPPAKPTFELVALPVPLDLKLRRDAHVVNPDKGFESVEFKKSGSDFRAFATFETERKYYVTEWSFKQWKAGKAWNAIEADALHFPTSSQLKDIEKELDNQSKRLTKLEALVDKVISFIENIFKGFKGR